MAMEKTTDWPLEKRARQDRRVPLSERVDARFRKPERKPPAVRRERN